MKRRETENILSALRRTDWRVYGEGGAAELLGIKPSTLASRMKRMGLEKIWGTTEIVEDDAELFERLVDPAYEALPERIFVFHIDAWDVNCPRHMKPRWTAEECAPHVLNPVDRIAELETMTLAPEQGPQALAPPLHDKCCVAVP